MSKMVEQSAQKTPAVAATAGAAQQVTEDGYRLPATSTLIHAAKLAIVEDKPVLLDYWTQSLEKTVLIGVKDSQEYKDSPEKLLVKSEEEYTSPISKIYGAGTDYIIVTENSIYLVDKGIPTKRIST